MKVTVIRAFLLKGAAQAVGTTVEVADALGRELVAVGKAAPAAPSAPAGPMTTKTAAAAVAGAKPVAAVATGKDTQS